MVMVVQERHRYLDAQRAQIEGLLREPEVLKPQLLKPHQVIDKIPFRCYK